MSTLTVYWNTVTAKDDVNLKTLADIGSLDSSNIKADTDIAEGCRGVYYRSIISTELDFNAFLTNVKLSDVRKSRNEPDYSLLFAPKCKGEQSIGVLRIVRPKRFGKISGIKNKLSEAKRDQSANEFEVLLESTEFILEDVQEQMAERFQLQETFGDFNVFFFGRRAEIFTYSGSLLNAKGNLQWRNQFLDQYENFLRGSKCAELKARAYLLYDDVIREGFILSAAVNQNSSVDSVVKFSFTLLVTGKRILGQIPKTRTGVITLASDVKKVEGGITDFKFIRSTHSNLPSVGFSRDGSFHFEPLEQPGGATIPADLEQILRRNSLDAINAAGGEAKFASQDTVVQQDVLLDFIHLGSLRTQAKSCAKLISGDSTADSENSKGAEIASQLIGGTIGVEDLSLKEAISAADSMVHNNAGEIADAIADLKAASDFLSSQERRVATPPAKVDGPTASNYQESQQFILQSAVDTTNLVTLISDTKDIEPFLASLNETNKTVIDSGSARLLSAISDTNTKGEAETVLGFIATFCLLKSPTGSIMSSVSDLPDISAPGPNFLEYVKKQRIGKLRSIMKTDALPKEVTDKAKQAIDGVRDSSLVKAISLKTGIPVDGVEISDGVLQKSTVYDFSAPFDGIPTSQTAATFLNGVLTYVTGILAEKSSPPQACTADFIAAGPLSGGADVYDKYFTQSYSDDHVKIDGAPFKGLEPTIYQARQRIVTGPGGKYLMIPFMSEISPAKVTFEDDADGFLKSSANFLAGVFGVTLVPFTLDFVDAAIYHVGYMRLYQSVEGGFTDGMNIAVAFRGKVRTRSKSSVDANKVFGASRKDLFLLGKGEVRVSDYLIGGIRVPSATVITDYPAKRAYLGQNEYPSVRLTIGAAPKYINEMTSVVSRLSDKVFDAMASVLLKFIESGQVVTDGSGLTEELAIARFLTGPDAIPVVTNANKSMERLGVKSTTYIDFVAMAKIELDVVNNMKLLKASLEKAVVNAGTPEGKKAAEVSKSDVSVRNSRCGDKSDRSFSGPENTTGTFG